MTQESDSWFYKHVINYGARLQDVMHHLDKTPGGTLNPEFVEFLMGYPKEWTDLEKTESKHLETQSYPKSQEKSEKQLSKQKIDEEMTFEINNDWKAS